MRLEMILLLTMVIFSCEGRNKTFKSKHKHHNKDKARKGHSELDDYHHHNHYNEEPPLRISFAGNLRKYFALVSALDPPLKSSICSPLSALLPLGKLALGAKSKTLVELLMTVGANQLSELRKKFRTMLKTLQRLEGVDLDIASRIYLNDAAKISESFIQSTIEVFNSSVAQLDFSNPSEAVKIVNKWVESQTHGKIQNLLSPRAISRDISMVLVNAVYFMGKWERKFKKVSIETFYSPMGEQKIPMMHRTGYYRYVYDKIINSEIVEIPYKNKSASFIIVLPRRKEGLTMLLTALKLAPEVLNKALKKMESISVALSMPKFKIESTWDLAKSYRQLGMKEIFPGGEGMALIQKKTTTHVSAAVQKAFIEVDEDGTEAAAASGVQMVPVSLTIDKPFRANHPFLYFILMGEEAIFTGTVVKF